MARRYAPIVVRFTVYGWAKMEIMIPAQVNMVDSYSADVVSEQVAAYCVICMRTKQPNACESFPAPRMPGPGSLAQEQHGYVPCNVLQGSAL